MGDPTYTPNPRFHAMTAARWALQRALRRQAVVQWKTTLGIIPVWPEDHFSDVLARHRQAKRQARAGEA